MWEGLEGLEDGASLVPEVEREGEGNSSILGSVFRVFINFAWRWSCIRRRREGSARLTDRTLR